MTSYGKSAKAWFVRAVSPVASRSMMRLRMTASTTVASFAGRATTVVELDAGHHPFLSRPAEIRDLLLAL